MTMAADEGRRGPMIDCRIYHVKGTAVRVDAKIAVLPHVGDEIGWPGAESEYGYTVKLIRHILGFEPHSHDVVLFVEPSEVPTP